MQLFMYMDTIEFLKSKYILMKNVVDILKFVKDFLGQYVVACLVFMNYQARIGMMVARSYRVPRFKMIIFYGFIIYHKIMVFI